MQVILTEGQFKQLIQEEVIEEGIIDSLLGFTDPNEIVKKIVYAILSGTINSTAVSKIINKLGQSNQAVAEAGEENIIDRIRSVLVNLMQNNSLRGTNSNYSNSPNFQEKVEAVREYMAIAAKNQNFNPDNIQISPEKMVEACNKTGFDLPLLIAQAHLESCFGLTPRARRTNSVFSVGSYDSGKNAYIYATQNDSIEPYIRLVQNNYLGNRTIDDMLQPGAFVNGQNKRYATSKDYEKKVASIRNRIISKYPILA